MLSERLTADGRYAISLEGIAGRSYTFGVKAPEPRTLTTDVTAGGWAVLSGGPGQRWVTVTFPASGANTDGYTVVTVTMGSGPPAR